MTLHRNKLLSIMLALILLSSMTASLTLLANAQINGTSNTAFAYASAGPNPVAVGGTVYIAGWVTPPPHIIGNVFNNFTFVVTLPDGTKQTRYFPTSNIDATATYTFTCSQAGNYSVKLLFPGDAYVKNVVSVSYTWSAIPNYVTSSYPDTPLPTGYWSYPVNAQYYNWYQITGGWLWAGNRLGYDTSNTNYNPYSTGPTTSHVLWRRQWDIGGLMGGQAGASTVTGANGGRSTGTAIWNNLQPVAANGRMYYTTTAGNTPPGSNTTTIHPILWCIDQWTGETIYNVDLPINGSSTRAGTSGGTNGIVIREIPFIKGVGANTNETTVPVSYYYDVWVTGGGLWQCNAMTGDCLFYTPLPAGCSTVYSDNNFYTYGYPSANFVSCFNCVTKTWNWTQPDPFYFSDWAVGCVQIPRGLGIIVEEDNQQAIMNFRTRDLKTGNLLLNVTMPEISSSEKPGTTVNGMLIWHCVDGTIKAWSLTTGQQVWSSQPVGLPWSSFSSYWSANAYGLCYFGTWDGYIRAWNVTNGALVWQTYSGDAGLETGTGTYPWWGNGVIADGKIYAATGQHTPPNPLPRGDQLFCLDAFTGKIIWSTPFQSGYGGISSGILYYSNNYDDCLYAFGTGKSATSVSASPNLIQGTILDESPGAPDTPCVSADSMTAQMQSIYTNIPQAANTTGVPVRVTAIDPNGNFQNIGTVTSDRTGNYAIHWTPPVSGLYTITATFEGSGAYYSSSAETHIYIDAKASPQPASTPASTPAQTVAPTPEPTQANSPSPSAVIQPPASEMPLVTYVAIAAAIVVIVIAGAAITLRRRK